MRSRARLILATCSPILSSSTLLACSASSPALHVADAADSTPAIDSAALDTGAADGGQDAAADATLDAGLAARVDAAGDATVDGGVVPPADAAADAPSVDARSDGAADAVVDAPADGGATDASLLGYTLTWADEFDGPDGTPPDPAKWTYDVGGTGWGNGEREYYTNELQNSQQRGGTLVITATPNGASAHADCWYGTCSYTSARLKTLGLFSQAYGRFETRAQMPFGKGLWPAFWMMGADIDAVGWPTCGEIDILETIGTDISTNHGSLHAPNSFNPTGTYTLPGGQSFANGFHTYAVEWDPGQVRYLVDDVVYETQFQGARDGSTWEFDAPFFMLLNVAVGGSWPGDPDGMTTFPQTLTVDYVRAYKRTQPLALGISFDDPSVSYGLTGFGGESASVVADPQAPGNSVAVLTKPSASLSYAGTTMSAIAGASNTVPPLPVTTSRSKFSVRVLFPDANVPVLLKIEESTNGAHFVQAQATSGAAGVWQTLTFDMASPTAGSPAINPSYTYDTLSVFPDFNLTNAVDKTYYVDDVTFY